MAHDDRRRRATHSTLADELFSARSRPSSLVTSRRRLAARSPHCPTKISASLSSWRVSHTRASVVLSPMPGGSTVSRVGSLATQRPHRLENHREPSSEKTIPRVEGASSRGVSRKRHARGKPLARDRTASNIYCASNEGTLTDSS